VILLWGVPGDGPLDAVAGALAQAGAPVRFVDQRRAPEMRAALTVGPDGTVSGHIADGQGEIDLGEIGAAYIRPFETGKACGIEGPPDHPALLRAAAADAALLAWADLGPAPVVNRPAAMAANNSKPYQLAQIAASGFAVPDTLVTTDEGALDEFRQRHGAVIYKSVSGVRSIVARLGAADEPTLADIANCPTQFQEYVPGTDMRVHVAGGAVIATEIQSAADDYRYASRAGAELAMRPAELPPAIAERCRDMVGAMGLHFAGVDLRRTPAGCWYCFEVNPSPGFTFFEAGAGQPIAAAVAQLLQKLERSARRPAARRWPRRGHRPDGEERRLSDPCHRHLNPGGALR
jgi:hypothetical protein